MIFFHWFKRVSAASPWVGPEATWSFTFGSGSPDPRGSQEVPSRLVASVGTALHFIPSLFPPYPLSKGHGGFPALCPSNWDPSQLWESHVVLLSCASAKRVPQSRISFLRSHDSGAQGFLKALLREVGLLPLFIGTGRFLFPAPSSSPRAGPARSQATRVGGHLCCSLSLFPPPTASPFP